MDIGAKIPSLDDVKKWTSPAPPALRTKPMSVTITDEDGKFLYAFDVPAGFRLLEWMSEAYATDQCSIGFSFRPAPVGKIYTLKSPEKPVYTYTGAWLDSAPKA